MKIAEYPTEQTPPVQLLPAGYNSKKKTVVPKPQIIDSIMGRK
jgi:hypothetical protein